jgi:hypothetical protein
MAMDTPSAQQVAHELVNRHVRIEGLVPTWGLDWRVFRVAGLDGNWLTHVFSYGQYPDESGRYRLISQTVITMGKPDLDVTTLDNVSFNELPQLPPGDGTQLLPGRSHGAQPVRLRLRERAEPQTCAASGIPAGPPVSLLIQ